MLALFGGMNVAQVVAEFGVCRSDLYKLHRRALDVVTEAMREPVVQRTHAAQPTPIGKGTADQASLRLRADIQFLPGRA